MLSNVKETAFEAIDRNKEQIAKIGDSIFHFVTAPSTTRRIGA